MSDFFTAAREAKAARNADLLRALAGHPPAEEKPEAAAGADTEKPSMSTVSFDGGARASVPTPGPSEAEFYTALFEAGRGRGGGW